MRAAIACLVLSFGLGACYRPEPVDGAFTCSPDLGGLCPNGFTCNAHGLCVHPTAREMGGAPLDLAGDQASVQHPRTCDDVIQAGQFSNLTPLAAVNTAADETHLALDESAGTRRLLFQRGNQIFAAVVAGNDPKSVAAPQAVTLTGAPTTILGGSFTTDGKLWFAGTTGGTTSLYSAAPNGATGFTVSAPRAPQGTCPFSDPFFMQGDSTFQLYVTYALAGCGGAPYVARGALDRNLGAFFSALPEPSWGTPTMSPTGLLLIVAGQSTDKHLYAAARSDFQFQFVNAGRVPMGAIGEGIEDRQMVVSADCRTAYLVSVRSGGAGGADLYAADIAAP